jgi:hypothetical protein
MKPKYEQGLIDFDDITLSVIYTRKVHRYVWVEECHGTHEFTDEMIETTLEAVCFNLLGEQIHILNCLPEKVKEAIVKKINNE